MRGAPSPRSSGPKVVGWSISGWRPKVLSALERTTAHRPGWAHRPRRGPEPDMLDYAAVAGPTSGQAVGLSLKRYQVGSQSHEFSQALVYVDHLAVQHRQHVGAWTLAARLERDDLAYLRQGQTEALGGLDERQALHIVLTVFAVSRGPARRLREQAHPLVEAHGPRIDPDPAG